MLQSAPVAAEEEVNETVAGAQSPRARDPQSQTAPRAQRPTPRKERLTGEALGDEAELPATPSHRDAEEGYKPRPGLFSSPSKLPPRLNDPSRKSRTPRKAPAVHQDGRDIPTDGHVRTVENEALQTDQHITQPPDPEVQEKEREKARLEKELRVLEQQVSKCTEEIANSQVHSASHVNSPEEAQALVKFILDLTKDGEEETDDQPPALSSMLCSFLPFAPQQMTPPSQQPVSLAASHRPLELEDPLPYLQMFTSFAFSTRLSVPRGQDALSSSRVHQKHVIDITGPQSLLSASVSLTIDTLSNEIVGLQLLQLSHWAERELGTLMRIRAIEKDLGNACWAIGSYWDIAKKRAEYWHRCELAFGHLIPGRTSKDIENVVSRRGEKPSRILSRKDLNRHLGRDILVLENNHVLLKISWKIRFDWTGEAGSEVEVVPAVPRVCKYARDGS